MANWQPWVFCSVLAVFAAAPRPTLARAFGVPNLTLRCEGMQYVPQLSQQRRIMFELDFFWNLDFEDSGIARMYDFFQGNRRFKYQTEANSVSNAIVWDKWEINKRTGVLIREYESDGYVISESLTCNPVRPPMEINPPRPQPIPNPTQTRITRIDHPRFHDIAVDWCLSWRRACGKPAADTYCQAVGYERAMNFQQEAGVQRTRTLRGNDVCDGGNCIGFQWLDCIGVQ